VCSKGIGPTHSESSGPLRSNKRAARHVSKLVSRLLLACVFLCCAASVLAEDGIRQVQEELRKRHLYFGDIDGRENAELHSALKRYQARQGFSVSGQIDPDTAASLGLPHIISVAAGTNNALPDEPVLKGDFAREYSAAQREALEGQADVAVASVSPAPPAESPPPSDNLTPDRVKQFVENYLHDGENDDPAAQTKYYAFPLRYMKDGVQQDAGFIERDATRQIAKWPQRKFMLSGPVKFFSTGEPGEAHVEFTYAFEEARNDRHVAKGQAHQQWTVRAAGDEMKITQIDEEIVRRR
jgi:peptidoglycan hydrolase-like protein with peptidoglycan-binding domain